jgi:hypothetical protein
MPLLCGERTGIVNGSRPSSRAKLRVRMVDVGRAVIRQPFDRCACLRRAEALLDRCEHHIAHDVPAMAASSRCPTNSFPVMAVQRERHAQRRAIVTTELEAVRAPADVTLVNGNASIMSAGIASLAKAPEQQLMVTHDAIDPLGVHARRTGQFVTTSQQCLDSSVSISRQARHMLVDCSDQLRVVGLSGAAAVLPVWSAGFSDCQSRARHAENIADRFHWSSPRSKGDRAIQ